MTITVYRLKDEEKRLFGKLVEPFAQSKKDRLVDDYIHVSTLVGDKCIRKAVLNHIFPDQDVKNSEDFNNFLRGNFSEWVIVNNLLGEEFKSQEPVVWKGKLIGRPDALSMAGNIVIELKNSGNDYKFVDPRHYIYNSFKQYLMQTLYYMTISGVEEGHIIVLHSASKKIFKLLLEKAIKRQAKELGFKSSNIYELKKLINMSIRDVLQDYENDSNPLRVWGVRMSHMDSLRKELEDDIDLKLEYVDRALKTKDFRILPRENKDAKDSWCNICQWFDMCHKPENDVTTAPNIALKLRSMHIADKHTINYLNKEDELL